jgi:hypothetical protein
LRQISTGHKIYAHPLSAGLLVFYYYTRQAGVWAKVVGRKKDGSATMAGRDHAGDAAHPPCGEKKGIRD